MTLPFFFSSFLFFTTFFFFFNDTATSEIYTLSLHDALPICFSPANSGRPRFLRCRPHLEPRCRGSIPNGTLDTSRRSEEHTSELQSRLHLVCRLLLEKKKKNNT